jgi:hypothetical protein
MLTRLAMQTREMRSLLCMVYDVDSRATHDSQTQHYEHFAAPALYVPHPPSAHL